jgi:hypothetical protein
LRHVPAIDLRQAILALEVRGFRAIASAADQKIERLIRGWSGHAPIALQCPFGPKTDVRLARDWHDLNYLI